MVSYTVPDRVRPARAPTDMDTTYNYPSYSHVLIAKLSHASVESLIAPFPQTCADTLNLYPMHLSLMSLFLTSKHLYLTYNYLSYRHVLIAKLSHASVESLIAPFSQTCADTLNLYPMHLYLMSLFLTSKHCISHTTIFHTDMC